MKSLVEYLINESKFNKKVDEEHPLFNDFSNALDFKYKDYTDYEKEPCEDVYNMINIFLSENNIQSLDDIKAYYIGDGFMYKQIPDRLKDIKEKIKNLTYNKDEVSSVKELIKTTIKNTGSYKTYVNMTFGITKDNKILYYYFKSNASGDTGVNKAKFIFVKK